MKFALVAIVLAAFCANHVFGQFSMEDGSFGESDIEPSSLGLDLTYGWSEKAGCLQDVLEEQSKKIPALDALWRQKKPEAERLVERCRECEHKPKWQKPICFAGVSVKAREFGIKFYANLKQIVDEAQFEIIKDLLSKCMH